MRTIRNVVYCTRQAVNTSLQIPLCEHLLRNMRSVFVASKLIESEFSDVSGFVFAAFLWLAHFPTVEREREREREERRRWRERKEGGGGI